MKNIIMGLSLTLTKVIIKGVLSGGFIPEPSDETIATFNSPLDMVEAG